MVTNLLSPNVWVTFLVISGFYLQQTCADKHSNSNGTGSGTKIPCPDSKEAKKLFTEHDSHINQAMKKSYENDEYAVAEIKKLSMKLYKNVQDKNKLINTDKDSYLYTSKLCDKTVCDNTTFIENIYMGLSKCSASFCSDVHKCIRGNDLCPQDSDNLAILDGYTRCVKVKYQIQYKYSTWKYQDVCTCGFCDNEKKGAIFYLVFENTEAKPGVYYYLRLDSNPYTWSDLNGNYKVNKTNPLKPRQVVNLVFYAFEDQTKYAELFELKNSKESTCQSGAIYMVRAK